MKENGSLETTGKQTKQTQTSESPSQILDTCVLEMFCRTLDPPPVDHLLAKH